MVLSPAAVDGVFLETPPPGGRLAGIENPSIGPGDGPHELRGQGGHAGQPLKPCRRYTPDELAKLPFRERTATSCERGRWPVTVELDLDGEPLYRGTHPPAGLWDDGPSAAYARFVVPAGRHRIEGRLQDGGAQSGFNYTTSEVVELAPGENFVVDFRATDGGFVFGRALRGRAAGGAP